MVKKKKTKQWKEHRADTSFLFLANAILLNLFYICLPGFSKTWENEESAC